MKSKTQCNHKPRKIEPHHENFIDNYIIKSIENLEPYILKITDTPNYITIFRTCMYLLTSYLFYKSRTKPYAIIFIVAFCINYYLDCVDGYLARRCQKVSKLGDCLDHVSDLCSSIILVYFMYPFQKIDVIISMVMVIMAAIHMGNQQIQYSKQRKKEGKEDAPESIDILMSLSRTARIPIEISRYFGTGTWILINTILFMKKYKIYIK